MMDYFEGVFFPYQTNPVWPGSVDRCINIVHINKFHAAGDGDGEVDALYDPSGSKY